MPDTPAEPTDELNILPPTDASQTMAGVPRESALRESASAARKLFDFEVEQPSLDATPNPAYATTPQGMDSATTSAGRSCQVIVSGYELLEEIGRGGMGIVYRARNLGLQRDVAVKLLQEKFTTNGTAAERFLEEARITGQLQHPGVPPVHQVGRLDGGRPYLAMKLIKGQSLAALIDKKAPLNVLGVFEQIAQTLGYAHANRVIHRDLKPANIMVGAFGEVQVMDWGLAKVLDAPGRDIDDVFDVKVVRIHAESNSDLETKAGSVLGTPAFMPPEQARGEFKEVGPASDVFGLGAILCMMITGKPPFKGMDANTTRMMASEGKIDDAMKRLDECNADPEVVALCKKCLTIPWRERPKDGAAVAAEIAMIRAQSEERAKQAEVDKAKAEVQAAEARKRMKTRMRLGAGIAAALIAGTAGSFYFALDANRQKNKTNEAYLKVAEERSRLLAARANTVSALNTMTDDVIEKLFGRQPHLDDSEKSFLRKVIQLYSEATEGVDDKIEAKALAAEGNLRVGALQAKLGQFKEAEAALAEARAQRQAVIEVNADDAQSRIRLAATHTQLAIVYDLTNRRNEAITAASRAKELTEQLVKDFPSKPEHVAALAACRTLLAGIYFKGRAANLAEPEYLQALKERHQLAEDHIANVQYKIDEAMSHDSLGVFYRDTQRPDLAAKQFEEGVGLLASLALTPSSNETIRHQLCKVRNNLANLEFSRKQYEPAAKNYAESLEGFTALAEDYPGLPTYRLEQATAMVNLAVLSAAMNKPEEAEQYYQKAIAVQVKLAARNAQVIDYQLPLARTLTQQTKFFTKARKFDLAQDALKAAAKQYEATLALDSTNRTVLTEFRDLKLVTADLALARGKPDEVRAAMKEMVALAPEVANVHVAAAVKVARCARAAEDADGRLAVEYLETAVAKGFKDAATLDSIDDFKVLRGRADYKALREKLSSKP